MLTRVAYGTSTQTDPVLLERERKLLDFSMREIFEMATKGKTIKPDREAQPRKGGKGTATPGMKGGYGTTGGKKMAAKKKKSKAS